MAALHVCPCCGSELSRKRALRDPVYGLPIVVCPCGAAWVRRRHPIAATYRRAMRTLRAVALLIAQCTVITGALFAITGLIMSFGEDLVSVGGSWRALAWAPFSRRNPGSFAFANWCAVEERLTLELLVGVAIFLGVWLGATIRPARAWGVLTAGWGLPVGVFLLSAGLGRLDRLLGVGHPARFAMSDGEILIGESMAAAVCCLVSAACLTPGRGLGVAMAALRGSRTRSLLRAARKRRRSA